MTDPAKFERLMMYYKMYSHLLPPQPTLPADRPSSRASIGSGRSSVQVIFLEEKVLRIFVTKSSGIGFYVPITYLTWGTLFFYRCSFSLMQWVFQLIYPQKLQQGVAAVDAASKAAADYNNWNESTIHPPESSGLGLAHFQPTLVDGRDEYGNDLASFKHIF